MATKSPIKQQQSPLTSPTPPTPTPTPTPTPVLKSESPKDSSSRPPETPSTDADVIHVPSYSRWFSWDGIDECEVRFLPEFFSSKLPSKNPRTYMYIRNSIIKKFRENPSSKVTFTEVRKTLVGDVGSVRRVFDFLETWGLVNYTATAGKQALKWEDKESKASATGASTGASEKTSAPNAGESVPTPRWCSGCKSLCTIACFASDKYDMTLCARCYVRGNYRVGLSASDLRRVEINEETKTDWTDKETLYLLEAIMHYGDDWKKIAEHVGGRSEKECVSRFIKLPFGQELLRPPDSDEVGSIKDQNDGEVGSESIGPLSSTKKMRLTPLADASNPIMAQAAFLSALAGVEVADAAAQAAVTASSEVEFKTSKRNESQVVSNGDLTSNAARANAKALLEKEQLDIEREISGITDMQMKEIQDKILRFEELDKQVEKERKQLQQMKDLLFADQLKILFQKATSQKMGEPRREGHVSS